MTPQSIVFYFFYYSTFILQKFQTLRLNFLSFIPIEATVTNYNDISSR